MLEVNVEVWNKQKMMLHTELAKGETHDGEKFRVIQSIPPGLIVAEFPEAQYAIRLEDIVGSVIGFREAIAAKLINKQIETAASELQRTCQGAEVEE